MIIGEYIKLLTKNSSRRKGLTFQPYSLNHHFCISQKYQNLNALFLLLENKIVTLIKKHGFVHIVKQGRGKTLAGA